MKYAIWKMITLPDCITLLNIICGILAILFSINGQYNLGMTLLIAAVVFDYLDGKVARWLDKQHQLGKELDSLADIISFGVAPAVIGYLLSPSTLMIVAGVLFVSCGALRLARFGVMNIKNFVGVPITVNGVVFPLLYFVSLTEFYSSVLIIMGLLMISSFEVKKW